MSIELTDMKQIAYLNMKGIQWKEFKRDKNKKIFIFEDKNVVDNLLSEYYNSEFSKFIGCYENIKTLVYRT